MSPRPRPGGPSQPVGYVLLSGVAWGIVVTTFESLSQPPLELSPSEFLAFYPRILLHFGVGGIVLAWLTSTIVDSRRRFSALIAAILVLCAAMAAALTIDWLSVTYVSFWRDSPMSAMWQATAVGAHMAWTFSVYGGLYVLTFLFLRNEARSRERLRLAELARIDAEARMDRALAEKMLPAVAPDLLVRALSELARRYDENDGRADRLLDRLVQLLRAASGAAGKAQPRSESDIAAKVATLCGELERPASARLSFDKVHTTGGVT